MKNEKRYLREERSKYLNGCIEIGCLGMQLLIFYFNTITILERLDNALDKATYVHNKHVHVDKIFLNLLLFLNTQTMQKILFSNLF